jgi:hypothetical protein
MLSVQSADVLGSMLWSLFDMTDVLCATRRQQFGATVSSPIASVDVHFRNSSTAAGCKLKINVRKYQIKNILRRGHKTLKKKYLFEEKVTFYFY